MNTFAHKGMGCIKCSMENMIIMARPGSMLNYIQKEAPTQCNWTWLVGEKECVLLLHWHQVDFISRKGIPTIPLEKDIITQLYELLHGLNSITNKPEKPKS